MKLAIGFLRLIRWPNLFFMAITQCLFYYAITLPVFAQHHSTPVLTPTFFWLILLASVLIAAAGYIINDYFDLNIDSINKPGQLVVDKIIKRRWAILLHLLLSLAGLAVTFYVAFSMTDIYALLVGMINVLCVIALWFYSTTFKRKLLIGNLIVSLLTAWTVLIPYFIELRSWFVTKIMYETKHNYELASTKLFKLAVLYASFAFIISLIREAIKDMEDMEGDARFGCKTMPIVWGVPATKVFTGVWIVVLVGALCIVQFYALQLGWWWSALYCFVLIIVPLIWILKQLYRAQLPRDYHRLSTAVKLVMLTGILSMLFFKVYS